MNVSILACDQLLAFKFFIPSASHTFILRSRLTDQLLRTSFYHSFTLVSAPVGFGKTTLLSSSVQPLPKQVRLEQLERDNVFVTSPGQQRRWYRHHALFAGASR
jgi:ATP/maltotriose-dependent transcriptional regulator MalT